ncbi:hypothetical protein [Paraburkholderia bannensis]|uniref:hypothetical protein n=1 Tax=Paraburkholderia bannensis TaxID=765414 RepID=UPI002ABDD9AE|nr:hypothetical protein [Paraburkholderia bannensis]
MTAPRAPRRTLSIENSAAARRLAETRDTDLHPTRHARMFDGWQNELFSKFPLFFRAVHHPDAYPTNISRLGIECGAGWYSVIEALASDVELELRTLWRERLQFPDKLAELDTALVYGRATYPLLPICTDIEQVQGKFVVVMRSGSLCPDDVWSRICQYIDFAEERAQHCCESCGKPGTFREDFWRRVYCDDCITPEAEKSQPAAA